MAEIVRGQYESWGPYEVNLLTRPLQREVFKCFRESARHPCLDQFPPGGELVHSFVSTSYKTSHSMHGPMVTQLLV